LAFGLTLSSGLFEGLEGEWLRFVDEDGNLLLAGNDRAEVEKKRVERMARKLRELGLVPDEL